MCLKERVHKSLYVQDNVVRYVHAYIRITAILDFVLLASYIRDLTPVYV